MKLIKKGETKDVLTGFRKNEMNENELLKIKGGAVAGSSTQTSQTSSTLKTVRFIWLCPALRFIINYERSARTYGSLA